MRHEDIAAKAAKAGFTLIEIIIAISIVGIMAAVAVPNINKYLKNARINAARQLIDTAKNATIQYQNEHKGKVPETQDAWVEALTGGEEPYIEGGATRSRSPGASRFVTRRRARAAASTSTRTVRTANRAATTTSPPSRTGASARNRRRAGRREERLHAD